MESKRLSWEEIREKYPHQWVGLVDVEREEPDSPNIKTAIVKYINKTRSELANIKFGTGYDSEKDLIYRYTTPHDSCDMGFLTR